MQFKKRGQGGTYVLVTAIELLLAFAAVLLLLKIAHSWGTTEVFNKVYLAQDNALLINSLYAVPGNIFILYPTDMSKFSYSFLDDKVEVYTDPSDITKAVRLYIPNKKTKFSYNFKNPGRIIFSKTGNDIGIIPELKKPSLNKISCPALKSVSTLGNQNLLIDAGHGDGTEIVLNGLNESEINLDIAVSFFIRAENEFSNIYNTRIGDIRERRGRSEGYIDKVDNADLIVSIHTGNYQDKNKNNIKVYYSFSSEKSEESKALACNIVNNILDGINEVLDKEKLKDITGAAIIPVDITELSEDDGKQILNNNKIAVLLEMGNIQIGKNMNMLDDIDLKNAIGKAIYDSMSDYYG